MQPAFMQPARHVQQHHDDKRYLAWLNEQLYRRLAVRGTALLLRDARYSSDCMSASSRSR